MTWLPRSTVRKLRHDAERAFVLGSALNMEREAHALTRVTLAKVKARAAALDDRLAASRIYIASLERDLASKTAGAWRWRMSTSEGESSVTND